MLAENDCSQLLWVIFEKSVFAHGASLYSQTMLKNYRFQDLFHSPGLQKLDGHFLGYLQSQDLAVSKDFQRYRAQPQSFSAMTKSELLIAAAKILEQFLAEEFDITAPLHQTQLTWLSDRPIFVFQKYIVQRRAKRLLAKEDPLPSFEELSLLLAPHAQEELTLAKYAQSLLENEAASAAALETLTHWCIQAIKTEAGQAATKDWVSLKLPKRTDYQSLVSIPVVMENLRERDGFHLTDPRASRREVHAQAEYCIYCHDHEGDFCSKGFPEKKGDPEQGFKTNPLGNILSGCPLEQKISEMNLLKRDGYSLAALAVIMIDNPLCPATGHRICNDCMKACIYQKQDPVNIPQIETRTLSDVLALPYGVEIYDLLTRWNPLRETQIYAKPYNGRKVFIAGMGPAGFTLAHHLLMEGCAVVGSDGLKIEPLPRKYLTSPIRDFSELTENLDDRVVLGFGGVTEYGITVRWDKNFLKLIYMSLLRRPYFQVFDGLRFGGTICVEDFWSLGFDHGVIAVGAGLPKALPIPGSMAIGMRQANGFLMALQLTGAAKKNSFVNLQIRLPLRVIGGGLTGIDTATEAKAYYIRQVEKTLERYEILCKIQGQEQVHQAFDEPGLKILEEFVAHGKLCRKEREQALRENREPRFNALLRQFGGVSIVYRRNIQDSPAYISNHEELQKALEEDIDYLENLEPQTVVVDMHHHVQALLCKHSETAEPIRLDARCILVATGAQPNIAYEFEHKGSFQRLGLQYQPFEARGPVAIAPTVKSPDFGPFTSYVKEDKRVSFMGDTHPVFHGNVVNAMASAMRSYPKIMAILATQNNPPTDVEYPAFTKTLKDRFTVTLEKITEVAPKVLELLIRAPQVRAKLTPGQFIRLQNYEYDAPEIQGHRLLTEPLAFSAVPAADFPDCIRVFVIERGASSKMCRHFRPGQKLCVMGPTGVRSKIPQDSEHILIVANQLGTPYFLSVAKALKEAGNRVTYLGYFKSPQEIFCRAEIEALADRAEFLIDTHPIEYLIDEAANLDLGSVDRMTLVGSTNILAAFKAARTTALNPILKPSLKVFAGVYSTMQCMLKGVCAECLQWQIDPNTGSRKKAVFACSWQDQPIELIDLENLDERLEQNHVCETLSNLWIDQLLKGALDAT